MHSSQLFVPPTLVERRRVALSPDFLRAWQLVGWAGVALLAAGTIDLLFATLTTADRAPAAELVAATDRLHVLVLGLGLCLASAVARGGRTVTRTLASTSIALGALLALLALLATGGTWTSTGASGGRVSTGSLRALVLLATYSAALIALGLCAWRHALRHQHVRLGD